MKLIQILKNGLLTSVLLLQTACQSSVHYAFGYSAEESNKFVLVKAQFDNTGTPGGSLGCCLGDGGSSASMFPDRYPKTGYFEWFDEKLGYYYRASLTYPDNLKAIADSLPDKVLIQDTYSIAGNTFITSFTNDFQAISYLANHPFGRKHIKRTIVEVGRAQGERFIPEFAIANCARGTESISLQRFCKNVPEEIAAYRAKQKAEGKANPQ